MQTTRSKAWSRPPISLSFNVSMFTSSGVYVRYARDARDVRDARDARVQAV